MRQPPSPTAAGGQLDGRRILITGATGKIAAFVARELATSNDVWGIARFRDMDARRSLEQDGVTCLAVDLAADDFPGLPSNFDVIVNFAVAKTDSWATDLDVNVGGLGRLMAHCHRSGAIVHCSSTAVYRPKGRHRLRETDALGGYDSSPRGMATYSIAKISAEAMAQCSARLLSLPTVIARLNVPYGVPGLWPERHLDALLSNDEIVVHENGPCLYNPIHVRDLVSTLPALVDTASVPAEVVNWAGPATVSIEDWTRFLGSIVGREPRFRRTRSTIPSVAVDTHKLQNLIDDVPMLDWRLAMRTMAELRLEEINSPPR